MNKNATHNRKLDIDLSDPGAIPASAIDATVELLKSGRLHRYGEYANSEPHVTLLEQEFADYLGAKYVIGVNSGGCALFLGLKAMGVVAGDNVLVNAFNLAPVPGAIVHAGANAVLVEIDQDYGIDFDDLKRKQQARGARVLLLTHMRGHIVDMEKLVALCQQLDLLLIEDCAHTMGAKWGQVFTGRFGQVGCFSSQTFKHINSGEGGLVATDDDDIAAKTILYSGSYMLYRQHQSAPPQAVFDKWQRHIPNFSMRMSNLVACLLRPQLNEMQARGELWNYHYRQLEKRLNVIDRVRVPARHPQEQFVASSIQFNIDQLTHEQYQQFADNCTQQGVAIKWFGRDEPVGYTSQYHHWQYLKPQSLTRTTEILRNTFDMRIPLSLEAQHYDIIAAVIEQQLIAIKTED